MVSRLAPPNWTCKISPHPALQGSSLLAENYFSVRTLSGFDHHQLNFISFRSNSLQYEFPLVPFAMWTARPPSDYYGTTDAAHVSLPDCWEHLYQGSLPRSCQWTLQWSLGSGYPSNPSALCGSRPGNGLYRLSISTLHQDHELPGFGIPGNFSYSWNSGRCLVRIPPFILPRSALAS
jgi:hypothetical protein